MPGKNSVGGCIHRLVLETPEEATEVGVIMGTCKRCGARVRHEPYALSDYYRHKGDPPPAPVGTAQSSVVLSARADVLKRAPAYTG